MKVIFVMADSLRRDHVNAYGSPAWGRIETPSFERFAGIAAVFEDAYVGSFPTVPNRRDTLIGHGDLGLPFNRWKALEPEEATFPRRLGGRGIPTMLITDTQNNVVGLNLFRDYGAWMVNRGQEADRCWMDDSVKLEFAVPPHLIRYKAEVWHQVLVNRAHRKEETDWFAPGTYSLALKWLEQNHRRKEFFLWIDTFDPHEPWDPPKQYLDRYDPGYEGRVFEAPTYGVRKQMGITDRELQHIRARYAAEVTMVDHWFGRLLDKLEALGILDETAVILTADHGTCFDGPGDQGMLQKAWMVGDDGMLMSAGLPAKEPRRYVPLSRNIVRVPLFIHLPGMRAGRRVQGIVQPWDLHATICDLFGAKPVDKAIGHSLLPLIAGQGKSQREVAVSGTQEHAQVTTERWLYAVWRGQRPACLYDLQADPDCEKDVLAQNRAVAAELHQHIVAFVRGQGIGEEYLAGYQI